MYIEAVTNGMNQEFLLLRYHGLGGVGFSRGSDLMAEGSYVRVRGSHWISGLNMPNSVAQTCGVGFAACRDLISGSVHVV